MTSTKWAIAVILLAGASAWAADKPANDGPMQGFERASERGADRLARDFDINRDGRVTRSEMNNVLGWRFASATHHGPSMSLEQFMAERTAEYRKSNEAMFHRIDWNGDGKLVLAEYGAAQRVRFVQLDREGVGFVSCSVRDQAVRGYGRAGLAGFCRDNDTNMDGRVTRSELDAAIAKRFAAAASGQTLGLDAFVKSEEERYAVANVRQFRRLDTDEDGLLTLKEFAAPSEDLFDKIDKNRDGVLTPAEITPRTARTKERSSDS